MPKLKRKTQVIRYIKSILKDKDPRMLEWFETVLDRVTITLLPEAPQAFKDRYIGHIKRQSRKGTDEFRAYHYPTQIFTYAQEARRNKLVADKYGKVRKSDIVLNDNNETIESLSWLLLHELGHAYIKALDQYSGMFADFIRALNNVEAHIASELGGFAYVDYWDHYLTNDKVHESRPEEVFCNMIANAVIGKQLDRIWWRKYRYNKEGEL